MDVQDCREQSLEFCVVETGWHHIVCCYLGVSPIGTLVPKTMALLVFLFKIPFVLPFEQKSISSKIPPDLFTPKPATEVNVLGKLPINNLLKSSSRSIVIDNINIS